jgi:tRNA(Ile)-lysidine synthase
MEESISLPSLEQQLAQSWPPSQWCDVSVLVAVSGGSDSVALLRALAAIKKRSSGPGRLIVGHFNHHLRSQADGDAGFVAGLANKLGLMFALGEAEVAKLADQQGDGIEAAARTARYAFFQEAAQRHGARYVVTGHTADDQAETVLFNVLRGTGLSGLAGIPRVRPLGPAVSLIRPMLSIRRCEVMSYLAQIKQDYCVDPTNASSDFARNRIRHELLPLVRRGFNHDIDGALCRLSHLAGDAQRVIENLADELLDRCVSRDQKFDAVIVKTKPLVETDRHLIRELFIALWRREGWPLQDMGFAEWESLATMAADGTVLTKKVFAGGVVAERLPNVVRLRREGLRAFV